MRPEASTLVDTVMMALRAAIAPLGVCTSTMRPMSIAVAGVDSSTAMPAARAASDAPNPWRQNALALRSAARAKSTVDTCAKSSPEANGPSQMVVNGGDFIRVQLGGKMTTAARAIFVGEDEHLIHTSVESVCAEGVRQLVDQVEHDFVNFGMQGAITAAVNPGIVGIFARGFVEFGMGAQQAIGHLVPGLMAEEVDLRYYADPGNFAAATIAAHRHERGRRDRRPPDGS